MVDMESREAPEAIKRVTVYASSSNALAESYYDAAARLGTVLGQAGVDIVYGGGGVGLMRAMADRALGEGAHVHGVIPDFLNTVEHGHKSLSRLEVVSDMRERKHRMLVDSDAVVSLPGGSGTFEEVFEVLTLKRLGVYVGPIVLVNTMGFYDRLLGFLEHSVSECFMGNEHADMWDVVNEPGEVVEALVNARPWSSEALQFANVRG